MANLNMIVPDSFVSEVRQALGQIESSSTGKKGSPSVVDIAREALGVYKWMVQEMARGNAVVSVDRAGAIDQQIYTDRTAAPQRQPDVAIPARTDDGPVSTGSIGGDVFP